MDPKDMTHDELLAKLQEKVLESVVHSYWTRSRRVVGAPIYVDLDKVRALLNKELGNG